MKVSIHIEAEIELENAFDYYEAHRPGLGLEMIGEFNHGREFLSQLPSAWHPLEEPYRRYKLRRFPYGIIYRPVPGEDALMIVAFAHLRRSPGFWDGR